MQGQREIVTTQVVRFRVQRLPCATEWEDETAFTAYDHVAFHHRILLCQVWARGSRLFGSFVLDLHARPLCVSQKPHELPIRLGIETLLQYCELRTRQHPVSVS